MAVATTEVFQADEAATAAQADEIQIGARP